MGALVWKKDAGSYAVGVQSTQPAAGTEPASTSGQQQAGPQPPKQPHQQQHRSSSKRPLPTSLSDSTQQHTPGASAVHGQSQQPNEAHKRVRTSAHTSPRHPAQQDQQARANHDGVVTSSQSTATSMPATEHMQAKQQHGPAMPNASRADGTATTYMVHHLQSVQGTATVVTKQQQVQGAKPRVHLAKSHLHPAQAQQQQQQQQQQQPGRHLARPAVPQPPAACKHAPSRPSTNKAGHAPAHKQHPKQQLQAKEDELEALKARIAAAEAAAAAKAAAEAARAAKIEQERAAEHKAAEEVRQRRARLNSAFAPAFAAAAQQQAESAAAAARNEPAAASEADRTAEDAREVARVLAAKGDWEALGLGHSAGSAALKKRYKELAVRLHPDKCRAGDATAAFQRVHRAYLALSKFVV